ncbi:MAG: Txe/YoeB family addiction module toxin [Paracoccaceae bacterium]
MNLLFRPKAWEHLLHWQETDRTMASKINGLIKECRRHPFEGTGKPEPLKGELAGYWSRRITQEHRLVYRVKEDQLEILSCRFHYSD